MDKETKCAIERQIVTLENAAYQAERRGDKRKAKECYKKIEELRKNG